VKQVIDWLKGKKTFVVCIAALIVAIMGLYDVEVPEEVWAVFAALGLAFVRAGIKAIESTPTGAETGGGAK